jgi:class 3 adenylate cyclase
VTTALLFALWLAAFALSLDGVIRRTAYSPIMVDGATSADDYPRVVGFKAGLGAERSGLAPGDRLLTIDGQDLRGARALDWIDAVTRRRGGDRLEVAYERGGVQGRAELIAGSYRAYWPRLVASLAFAACVAFLLTRVRASALRQMLVYSNLAVAAVLACSFAGRPLETGFGVAIHFVGLALAPPLALLGLQALPTGSLPRSRWARYGPWIFALFGPFDVSRYHGFPLSWNAGALGNGVLGIAFLVAMIAVQVRAWRGADALGKRKLKWALLGFYLAAVPYVLAEVAAARDPGWGYLLAIAVSGLVVLPICLIIAISRYNFLDVDTVLSSTGALTLLAALFLAIVILGVPAIAAELSAATGLHELVSRGVTILALLGLLFPLHGRLREEIERFLFADRRNLTTGVTGLAQDLSRCATPDEVVQCAGQGVVTLLRPASCALYTRVGEVFTPAFAYGEVAPPRFAAGSPLVAVLAQQSGPLALEHEGRDAETRLGAFQRAVVDTLGAPLVVPMRQEGDLLAFLCLGPKHSGDVYAAPEVALVALVADKLASELLRLDQAARLQEISARQERLRRYVPGTLADRLEEGQQLDVGETEVSVLFVDLRGYASYAEDLAPGEIFSSVNHYTELVSSVIHAHGGTVVEFNGDGMMAVFGAPRELEGKERAAVAAGREIVLRVPALTGAVGTLSVGVGVATGPAFVGNVHAVDRLIWTALGNTTNLASRLQSLTRDLDAAMIIDEATWRRAGSEAQLFRPAPETEIRGRKERQNLYLLPLPV